MSLRLHTTQETQETQLGLTSTTSQEMTPTANKHHILPQDGFAED